MGVHMGSQKFGDTGVPPLVMNVADTLETLLPTSYCAKSCRSLVLPPVSQ